MFRKYLSVFLAFLVSVGPFQPVLLYASSDINPAFQEVEANLDEGGDSYFYMNVRGSLRAVMDRVRACFREAGPEIQMGFTSADRIFNLMGLYNVEDIGSSSIRVGDHYRSKSFLRIPGEKKGLFRVFGGEAHSFASVKYAPPETAFFVSSDFNATVLFELIREAAFDLGGQQATIKVDAGLDNFNEMLKARGIENADARTLMNSLGREFALICDIDPKSRINIPLPASSSPLNLPFPRFALLLPVKDAALYDVLSSFLKQSGVQEISEGEWKKIFIPVPPNPVYPVQPVLAFDGSYVILSTHGVFLQTMIDVKKSGKGLSREKEYAKLLEGLPEKGNSMIYMSREGLEKLVKIGEEIEKLTEGIKGSSNPFDFMKFDETMTMGMAAVRTTLPNGIIEAANSQSGGAAGLSFVTATAVMGIMSAIAVPGFLRARTQARLRACQENLSRLDGAKEQWALEHRKKNGDTVNMSDLVGPDLYLRREPVCPRGGTYTLGKIGEDPTCSCGARLPY